MASEQWANAETCRDLIEDKDWLKTLAVPKPEVSDDEDDKEIETRDYVVEVSGKRFDVVVHGEAMAALAAAAGTNGAAAGPRKPRERKQSSGGGGDALDAPLQGNMWKVLVSEGDEVEEGQLICIIEAMKMENEIQAHKAGKIAELAVKEGEPIKSGDRIAVITAAPAEE